LIFPMAELCAYFRFDVVMYRIANSRPRR
jgi:hypothetical protein